MLDYLNTVPLAAAVDYGEVTGIGDGLWAWYGADFQHVNELLRRPPAKEELILKEQAKAYRQVLSLLIAQRRPTHFLLPGGREHLATLTDSYLRLTAAHGIISEELRDAALDVKLDFRTDHASPRAHDSLLERRECRSAIAW